VLVDLDPIEQPLARGLTLDRAEWIRPMAKFVALFRLESVDPPGQASTFTKHDVGFAERVR
jgi:hypothetical protein